MGELALRDYQIAGVKWLQSHPKAGLLLDMGLGKTAISLSALTPEHLPALVIAPKRVAETVWDAERDLWRPDLSVALAVGSKAARQASLASGADVTVISRDNQAGVLDFHYLRPKYKTLILDEMSGYKGRGVRWKDVKKLIAGDQIEHVWGLTGTPIPNGYMDLWPQIYLLDGGKRLGRNITTFRSRFFYPGRQLPNGVVIEWNLKPGAEEKIQELIEDICLSMGTEGRVDLPPVTYNTVKVTLPPPARRAYKDLKAKLVADMKDIFGTGEKHTASSAGVLTGKLAQISAGFLFKDEADLRAPDDRWVAVHDAKIKAAQEIVEGTGSPVLIAYRFTPELEMLKKAFPQAETINGKDVIRRWNKGKVPVMLAHPASAAHGLNLQHGGHTIIWTSLTWDSELWLQFNKRLLRSGQKNPVVIHKIMTENSVDFLTEASLEGKTFTQAELLDYLESPI